MLTSGKPTHATCDYAEHAIDYREKISAARATMLDLRTSSQGGGRAPVTRAESMEWLVVVDEGFMMMVHDGLLCPRDMKNKRKRDKVEK